MAQFTDTIQGTFDAKKSRLSVPALFRQLLARMGAESVVLRKSSHSKCIEVWPQPDFEREVNRRIGELDPFSPDFQRQSSKLVGRAVTIVLDGDGRMVLPARLIEAAQLESEIAFAGRAKFFEIWNARLLEEHEAELEAEEAA
jgi:MraZ protein